MTVGRICTREVHLASPDESVREAAWRMAREDVGSLVVLDAEGRPMGILTDRDIATRTVAGGHDPAKTSVERTMTREPRTVREDTPIEVAVRMMREHGYRRLPVLDAKGRLVGVLSLSDVLDLLGEEMESIRALASKASA